MEILGLMAFKVGKSGQKNSRIAPAISNCFYQTLI